jgi:hypothetical protein
MGWLKNMYPGEKKKPVVKRCARQAAFDVSSQSGASLIIIIISILVLGVLAAAMYAITSSSYFNQASSQDAMKALYLAEAGPRIVASEYKAATAADKNTKLADLNGRTFNTGGSSQFKIDIYPYWLYALTALTSSTSIILNLPGGLPLQYKEGTAVITFPTRGILKVRDKTAVRIFTGASAAATTAAGTPTTFTLSSAFPSTYYPIPINSELFIGFVQNEAGTKRIFDPQTVSSDGNGNLILNTTGAIGTIGQFFPPENGNFSLDFGSGMYNCRYDKRDINSLNSGKTTLTKVQVCPPSTVCPPYTSLLPHYFIYDNTSTTTLQDQTKTMQIYVGKSVGIRSTGLYGN